MKEFKIENNKIYSDSGLCENNMHVFQIVDEIPRNFFVWNIGENMGSDEYIPVCEDLCPEDKNDYSINIETLKAIRLPKEEVEALRKAAGYGIVDRTTAEKAIRSKRKGYLSNKKREYAMKTIGIFERISA